MSMHNKISFPQAARKSFVFRGKSKPNATKDLKQFPTDIYFKKKKNKFS